MKDTTASKPKITTDIARLTISKVVVTLISMVTAMMLSRFRTLEEFGTFSQIMLVTNLATTLFVLGLPNSLNYFLAKAEDETSRNQFLSTYYTISLILSIIIGAALFILNPFFVSYFDNPKIKDFLYLMILLPWTLVTLTSIDALLIIYKKVKLLFVFRASNALLLLGIVLLTKLLDWSFQTYMLSFMIVNIIFSLWVYLIARSIAPNIKIFMDKALTKEVFTFSIPIGLATVCGTIKKECDKLMIGRFYDTSALAIYANAAREIPVMFLTSSITAILMPRMVRRLKNNEKRSAFELWGTATLLSFTIICFFSTSFWVFASDLMTFFYSEKYITGVTVFRIYSLILIFRSTYFGMVLNSTGNTRAILYSSIIAVLSNIVLNFAFYYIWGFTGPALATVASTLISAYYLLRSTSRKVSVPIREFFPWRKIFKVGLLNVAFGALFLFLREFLSWEVVVGQLGESFILGMIWAFSYFLLIFRFVRTQWLALNAA